MSTRFDTLGFAPAYSVVVDPAFPPNGEWDVPAYAYGRNGKHIHEFDFESRWGTPLVVRVTTARGTTWVGFFAAGGLGTVRGVFAAPGARHVCAIVDGLAYLVDVDRPEQEATIAADAVVRLQTLASDLLLLAGDTSLVAVGRDGVAWKLPRLVDDQLRVLRASDDAIVCSGEVAGKMATITISPANGALWGSEPS